MPLEVFREQCGSRWYLQIRVVACLPAALKDQQVEPHVHPQLEDSDNELQNGHALIRVQIWRIPHEAMFFVGSYVQTWVLDSAPTLVSSPRTVATKPAVGLVEPLHKSRGTHPAAARSTTKRTTPELRAFVAPGWCFWSLPHRRTVRSGRRPAEVRRTSGRTSRRSARPSWCTWLATTSGKKPWMPQPMPIAHLVLGVAPENE